MAVKSGTDSNRRERPGVSKSRNERRVRENAGSVKNNGYYEKYEMAFAVLAMHDPRYLKRFEDDEIRFEGPLAYKIIKSIRNLYPEGNAGVHGADLSRICEALDPEEEAAFRRVYANTFTGPDDEAFYRETKSGYLSAKYKDEKAEITNKIAVAEKMGNTGEIEELAGRLIKIDALINKLTEEN